jgi:DMSO reductase anchor subunit
MHPALSVILFTTTSGIGYGLLFLFGIGAFFGMLPADRWFGAVGLGLALALITFGLLCSTFHLGHPERAWRAITQWRTSWLSREGVAAILTYIPAGLFAIGWVFLEANDGAWALLGGLAAVGAVVTVLCTAMIYASLKTVHQWHSRWTLGSYAVLALQSGLLWFAVLAAIFMDGAGSALSTACLLAALAGLATKVGAWKRNDSTSHKSTPETATGLGHIGKVSMLEGPHTEANYLMREMGFTIARKHAAKLRRIAVMAGFILPALLSLCGLFVEQALDIPLFILAALSASLGILVERWLFFAEAKHVVTLYYGAKSA